MTPFFPKARNKGRIKTIPLLLPLEDACLKTSTLYTVLLLPLFFTRKVMHPHLAQPIRVLDVPTRQKTKIPLSFSTLLTITMPTKYRLLFTRKNKRPPPLIVKVFTGSPSPSGVLWPIKVEITRKPFPRLTPRKFRTRPYIPLIITSRTLYLKLLIW